MDHDNKPGIKDWMRKTVSTDITAEEQAALYDEVAPVYDQDVPLESKPDPGIIAKEVEALFKDRKSIRILDVAAGTGYVGCELIKLGFKNIDALDCSARMLEIAASKQYYKNYFCNFFTKDPTPQLQEGSYDALVSTGSFVPGHLRPDCFVECLRLTKPGGYIILGMYNIPQFQDNDPQCLQDVIQDHSRLCTLVKVQQYENYSFHDKPGVVFIVMKV